jgi:hypothetical protein
MSIEVELSQAVPLTRSTGDEMVRENLEFTFRFLEVAKN